MNQCQKRWPRNNRARLEENYLCESNFYYMFYIIKLTNGEKTKLRWSDYIYSLQLLNLNLMEWRNGKNFESREAFSEF